MDEVVVRRVIGVITLALAAFLLSWLLPRPGLDRLRGQSERVVTMDLTRPDSRPEEAGAATPDEEGDQRAASPVTQFAAGEPQASPSAPGQARSGPPVAPAPVPPVAAQDLAPPQPPADPVQVIALPKPAPTAEPKPAPKPESKPVPKPEPKPEPKPAPETKPPVTVPPPPKPASETKPAPAAPSAGGKLLLRAGAYSLLEKAESVRKRAAALGVTCFVSPTESAKGTLYGLRCGPFADRAKADAAVKALTGDGIAAQVIGGG